MKEAAARIKINKLLEAAGWRFFADERGPANIQLEVGANLAAAVSTTQRAIVEEIQAEQTLVAANRELIARFEKKIQATFARRHPKP